MRIASGGGSCRYPHGPRLMCTPTMPGGERRADVVVHAVAHVGDLSRLDPDRGRSPARRTRARASRPPSGPTSRGRSTCGRSISSVSSGVLPTAATTRPGGAQPVEAGERVGIEVARLPGRGRMLDLEDLPHVVVVLAARGEAAEHAHQRERRHARDGGSALPHAGLVDERLADVEDDRFYSHAATRSRSARVVTLSSRSSPSTTVTRPPAASTSDAQSVGLWWTPHLLSSAPLGGPARRRPAASARRPARRG